MAPMPAGIYRSARSVGGRNPHTSKLCKRKRWQTHNNNTIFVERSTAEERRMVRRTVVLRIETMPLLEVQRRNKWERSKTQKQNYSQQAHERRRCGCARARLARNSASNSSNASRNNRGRSNESAAVGAELPAAPNGQARLRECRSIQTTGRSRRCLLIIFVVCVLSDVFLLLIPVHRPLLNLTIPLRLDIPLPIICLPGAGRPMSPEAISEAPTRPDRRSLRRRPRTGRRAVRQSYNVHATLLQRVKRWALRRRSRRRFDRPGPPAPLRRHVHLKLRLEACVRRTADQRPASLELRSSNTGRALCGQSRHFPSGGGFCGSAKWAASGGSALAATADNHACAPRTTESWSRAQDRAQIWVVAYLQGVHSLQPHLCKEPWWQRNHLPQSAMYLGLPPSEPTKWCAPWCRRSESSRPRQSLR